MDEFNNLIQQMKKIAFLFFLFFSTINYSQSINDGFYSVIEKDQGWTTDFYNFFNSKNFKYLSFDCTGAGFGTGEYEILNDSIYLKFKNFDYFNMHSNVTKYRGESDSLKIKLKITDGQSGLSYVNCFFVNSNQGTQSNNEGEINKAFSKNESKDLILRISGIGFSSVDIKIEKDVKEIEGTILVTNNMIYENKSETFKIDKISKNKIIFSFNDKNRNYEKLSIKQTIKKIKIFKENPDIEFYLQNFTKN
jgi:hypothetical protein